MNKTKILIVDDEIDIIEFLTMYLEAEKFHVLYACNGHDALKLVKEENPALIILDILLPGMDGLEICEKIRKLSISPIIFLSCKSEELDKIQGLKVGGDDYITKPFSPRELIARVNAHLRRTNLIKTTITHEKIISLNSIQIYLDKHEVFINNKPIRLSAKEFDLLVFLAKNPGKVFSLEKLFEEIWNMDNMGDTRTVMVHISNLRRKLEETPSKPKYIITIKGAGYKFNNI